MKKENFKTDCMWQGMDYNDYLFELALQKMENENIKNKTNE